MSNQQDAGEEELWQSWQTWLLEQSDPAGKQFADIVAADHAAARRARKLEEALKYHRRIFEQFRPGAGLDTGRLIAEIDALLSPATGKEEAG